jgi:endo-1,4-beta-mannosidase
MTSLGPRVGDPFRMGVNYWPRRKAMGWWKAFDRGEVAGELDVMADMGLSLLRVFLLWEDFQPTPDRVSADALRDLEAVCDAAAERGLGLDVTFFTGHMSGPNWAPPWLLGGGEPVPGGRQVVSGPDRDAGSYRNIFVDQQAIGAASLLVRTVVGRLHEHPGIWAWNLGNEPDLFALPPDDVTGPAWLARLARDIRELDSSHPVTIGLHADSLLADNGLRVDRMFRDCDLAAMHAYPIYSDLASGPTDPDYMAFMTALTASLSGRPTLAEEFGGCTAPPGEPTQTWEWRTRGGLRRQVMLSEEDLAGHLEAVLPRLVEVGAAGALLWCFSDYHPDLWDRPPCDTMRHERHFGLLRPDGSEKPHARVVRDFIAADPRVAAPSARARLGVWGEAFYADPGAALPGLLRDFRQAAA